MTKEQIELRVEQWNNNMNIFEIYDELRDGHSGQVSHPSWDVHKFI